MTTTPLLELRSFGAAFGDHVVLTGLTLALAPTGITSLMGPAGSGKSTLVRTLAGLNDPHPSFRTWGTALLDGVPLRTTTPAEMHATPSPFEARRRVGIVVQHARFFVDTVRENLVSALPNRSAIDQTTQTRLAVGLLRDNGLGDLATQLDLDVASLPKSIQRRLSIIRAIVADPLLLLADEPTAGLDDLDSIEVLTLLRVQSHLRAVLFVTHNQRFAIAAGGDTALLAGGRIREVASTREFFFAPPNELVRQFVRTGSCAQVITVPPERPATETSPPAAATPSAAPSPFLGPRGFFWVIPGLLGGLPRPGIVDSVESDLAALSRLGVTHLVTLEEEIFAAPSTMREHGIVSIHFPIADMGVPELSAATRLLRTIDDVMNSSRVVALHCRAGLGRTGTMLAATLVWRGFSARESIDVVRRINPRCIQSDAQIRFLLSLDFERRTHHPTN